VGCISQSSTMPQDVVYTMVPVLGYKVRFQLFLFITKTKTKTKQKTAFVDRTNHTTPAAPRLASTTLVVQRIQASDLAHPSALLLCVALCIVSST